MNRRIVPALLTALVIATGVIAQTEQAYDSKEGQNKGLLDPSRFTIHHAATFGMSSGGGSGLQSQSLYSTMMQYKFSQPVTLSLNFSLPIHSTYNSSQNLTQDNLQSMDYIRNMPFNASISWQPSEKFQMHLTVARESYGSNYLSNYYDPYRRFEGIGIFDERR